jgi:hypothetical protein
MSHELWDSAEEIVRELGEEIERNEPNSRLIQPGLGWQYVGKVFLDGTDRLKAEMKTKGYNVSFFYLTSPQLPSPTVSPNTGLKEIFSKLVDSRSSPVLCSTSLKTRKFATQQTIIFYFR